MDRLHGKFRVRETIYRELGNRRAHSQRWDGPAFAFLNSTRCSSETWVKEVVTRFLQRRQNHPTPVQGKSPFSSGSG